MADLRSCLFFDQVQPQTLAYLATWMRGTLPRERMAAQVIEISPGLDVEKLTDIAIKSSDVNIGLLIVERQYGTLEFHSRSTAEVHAGTDAVLSSLGLRPEDASRPKILASKIVTRIDHEHAYLINRNRLGSLLLAGESLYLLECQSASYAMLACNEAEKEANIKVIDFRMIGPNGRLYLSGSEAEVRNARNVVETTLHNLGGS